MPLWGTTDDAANSAIFAPQQFRKEANTANQTDLFGNTTADAFITGLEVGQFGVDAAEMVVPPTGNVTSYSVIFAGSGYFSNAAVAVTGGGGSSAAANAQANSIGKIAAVNVEVAGSSYETAPTVTIDPPAAQTFDASLVDAGSNDAIPIASNKFQVGDYVKYLVAAGNTALTNLANNTSYYVVSSNATHVQLSLTAGGAAIALTAGSAETGHSLTGQTALATATVTWVAGNMGFAHAGWNIRKKLSNGRVMTECLVALSKNGLTTDASDDAVLPDA